MRQLSYRSVPGAAPISRHLVTPAKYQSGENDRTDAISRCGDEMLRMMLYEAAQSMLVRLAKWSWLKGWAMKIARHRGWRWRVAWP
jgi:transposase